MATNTTTNTPLSEAQRESVSLGLNSIRNTLSFLIGLRPSDKQRLLKMGNKNRAFTEDAIQAGIANPGMLPRSIDPETLQGRLTLYGQLREVQADLQQIHELVDNTVTVIDQAADLDLELAAHLGALDRRIADRDQVGDQPRHAAVVGPERLVPGPRRVGEVAPYLGILDELRAQLAGPAGERLGDAALAACKEIGRVYPLAEPNDAECARLSRARAMEQVKKAERGD